MDNPLQTEMEAALLRMRFGLSTPQDAITLADYISKQADEIEFARHQWAIAEDQADMWRNACDKTEFGLTQSGELIPLPTQQSS